MMVEGIRLALLVGKTVAAPAPSLLMGALQSVEVTHRDEGHSGFQITFQVGRSGPADVMDYPILSSGLLEPFYRVILVVSINSNPYVLMDGVITQRQPSVSSDPGASTLTVTGEDISLMMDMEEKSLEHPSQDESTVASQIIGGYSQYGLTPEVKVPSDADIPLTTERTPMQRGTDLEHLQAMARRYGYVFYVVPGPVPHKNIAYWGPPVREGEPQGALSVNLGPATNVKAISFQQESRAAVAVDGYVQDRQTNERRRIQVNTSTRKPLSSISPLNSQITRKVQLDQVKGLTHAQALARAKARTDASLDNVVTASGELDVLQYGGILQPRKLVGLRGAGRSYDGKWYVKSVTHRIRRGEYKQSFTLTREGTGSTVTKVE